MRLADGQLDEAIDVAAQRLLQQPRRFVHGLVGEAEGGVVHRHQLARAEIGWGQDVYDGQDRRDERFFTGLGFDYVFTPRVRATLDWRYEERTSAVAGDATRNLVRLGLTTGY